MFGDKRNRPQLRILLDSDSLKSESAKRLLNYSDNELFEFVSLGLSTTHTVANVSFGDEDKWYVGEITIDKSTRLIHDRYKNRYGFGYRIADIREISQEIDIKFSDLILAFLLDALIRPESERKTILVTQRRKLLNRLNWRKGGFPRLPMHSILSPDEALIFIDLHCKKNAQYLVAPNYYTDKSLWYLYSLKMKLVSFQPAWSVLVFADETTIPGREDLMEMMASLGSRITDMLIAIDEIGLNYYAGITNDTQDTIIYHFNYWITLFTGVLDSLAWISKYRHQIEFGQQERIGLRTQQQKDFIGLLFQANSRIKQLLSNNTALISLMYNPRDLVVHRARLSGIRFRDEGENFDLNMVRISKVFFDHIVALSREKGGRLGKWGQYRFSNQHFLEPYRFVQRATTALIDFTNEYLRLLDFGEYEETYPRLKEEIQYSAETKEHEAFLRSLELFTKFRLGY